MAKAAKGKGKAREKIIDVSSGSEFALSQDSPEEASDSDAGDEMFQSARLVCPRDPLCSAMAC